MLFATRLRFPALAAVALTASFSLQLNLQGGYANRQLTACSLRHHFTFFHPRVPMTIKGTIAPAPSGAWEVKVKVKQCLRGRYRTVWAHHAAGQAGGSYKVSYPAARRGYFFARAYYYGATPAVTSNKQYFRVR